MRQKKSELPSLLLSDATSLWVTLRVTLNPQITKPSIYAAYSPMFV